MTLRAPACRTKLRTSLKHHAAGALAATVSKDSLVASELTPSGNMSQETKGKRHASESGSKTPGNENARPLVSTTLPVSRSKEDREQLADGNAGEQHTHYPSIKNKDLVDQEEPPINRPKRHIPPHEIAKIKSLDLPLSTSTSSTKPQKENKVENSSGDEPTVDRLQQMLARRNEELARIALYLRERDEYQSTLQRDFERSSKILDEANAEVLHLQGEMLRLRERDDRRRFSNTLAANEKLNSLQLTKAEQTLLFDVSRTRVSEDEIRRLAFETGLFDPHWYAKRYSLPEMDDVSKFSHYVDLGHRLGLNPSPLFDGQYYLAKNPDVDDGVANPLCHYIQFGVCERRKSAPLQESLVVRIIMMQRNEVDLLYPWALYHGLRFGFENLHVIDNGSDHSFRSRLEFLESIGVRVSFQYSKQEDFVNKGTIIANTIRQYDSEGAADFYFPIDCDEFIGVELEGGIPSFSKKDIFAELYSHITSPEALTVSTYYDNHPTISGSFKRTPGQRKSFFTRGTCEALDRGFNNPKVKAGLARRKTSIIYAHYHFKPYSLAKLHARQRLEAFLQDFSVESLRDYVKERKTGYHSARHLLATEREYLRRDSSLFHQLTAFSDAFDELGLPLPFSE